MKFLLKEKIVIKLRVGLLKVSLMPRNTLSFTEMKPHHMLLICQALKTQKQRQRIPPAFQSWSKGTNITMK